MISAFKNGLIIYRREFGTNLLISFTTTIPIQILFLFVANFSAAPFVLLGIPLWESIIQIFFIIVSFSIIQVPYVVLFHYYENEFDFTFKEIIIRSFKYFFLIYALGLFVAFLCVLGMLLFIIPGILLLIFLLPIPQSIILEENSLWKSIRHSISFGKANLGKLLLILFMFFLFDIFLSYLAYVTALYISNLIIIINFFFIAINGLLIPIFIFTLCSMYNRWIMKSEVALNLKQKNSNLESNPIH